MKAMKKTAAVVLMALALIVSSIPAVTFAETGQTVEVGDWAGLQAAISNDANYGKTIRLTDSITANGEDFLDVNGKTVIIDLNGKTLDRNLESSDSDGHVFWVRNSGSLTIRDSAKTGVITGGYATHGGAINISYDSTCTIEGGTITGNRAEDGGAFYVHGTLNISGGEISGNTATDGGGIFIRKEDGHSGKLNFSGGSVKENKAERGGGIKTHGEVVMTGGEVSGNSTLKGKEGGGVYVSGDGSFGMTDGAIKDNIANREGGGIYTEGTFTMNGGSITSNTTADSAGAICIRGGTTILSGGTISKNTAYNKGGAIYIDDASLEVSNVSITNNTGMNGGGGIWMDSETGSVKIKGKPVVHYNKSNDIHLAKGRKLVISGDLEEGTKVGVYLAQISGTFTKGFKDHSKGFEPYLLFTPEPGCAIDTDSKGEAKVVQSDWLDLQRQINSTKDKEILYLSKDWKATSEDKALVIPEGKTMTLTTNGHTIDRNLDEYKKDGEVLIVKGTLTINDNGSVGTITGGYGEAGGIRVEAGGTLNLEGCAITGNKSNGTGGGVLVKAGGTLNINGGLIIGNEANKGGGVCNYGTLKFTKGMVANNKATGEYSDGGGIYNVGTADISGASQIMVNSSEGNGGGLYLAKEDGFDGRVNVSGGSFTLNRAVRDGGGVYLGTGVTLNLSGGSIGLNYAGEKGGGIYLDGSTGSALNVKGAPSVRTNVGARGKNIMLDNTGTITIADKLSENAHLDVATNDTRHALTSGLTEKNEGSMAAFSYNESNQDLLQVKDGELYFKEPYADLWVGSWSELQAAIDNPDYNGKTIGLNKDISYDTNLANCIVVGNDSNNKPKIITLELNGHQVNGENTNTVCLAEGDAQFTIRDSAGTGAIMNGANESGGGIIVRGNATCILEGVSVQNNKTLYQGAGIMLKGNANLKMTGGRISKNESTNYYGGGIASESDGTIELKGVTISDNIASYGGAAINLSGTTKSKVHIEDCFIMNNSSHSGEYNGYGAVYVDKPVTMDIKNTMFSGNTVHTPEGGKNKSYGAAITQVELSTITITGGSFTDNKSMCGGAIYVGGSANLTMNDVQLTDNEDTREGGGAIHLEGALTMNDCVLRGNKSSKHGGAIRSSGKLDIKNSTFENNKSSKSGGAIYSDAWDLNMTDCTVRDNKAKGNGGGISLCYPDDEWHGSFTNVTISGNQADEKGGGIFIDEGKLLLNDKTNITGNTALEDGDGVYADNDTDEIKLKGSIQVIDNEGTDFYLDKGMKLKVADTLSGSKIGVTLKKDTGTFTKDFNKYHSEDQHPSTIFVAPANHSVVLDSDGEAKMLDTDWPNLQTQITLALSDAEETEVNTLTLEKDWVAKDDNSTLKIPSGKALILDLNGHTIDRNLDSDEKNGEAFTVEGSLTIKDSSGGIGKITGGYGEGGGICVKDGGSLTLEGGRITGNKAQKTGGGILCHAQGTVAIKGGDVSGNTANEYGGGIYSEGSVTVSGGSIDENKAKKSGGGLALKGKGSLKLSGGQIKENTAGSEGGGIFFDGEATVNAEGNAQVTENSAPIGNNILLKAGKLLGISGKLTEGAAFDLTTQNANAGGQIPLTSGLKGGAEKEAAVGFFTYNGSVDRLQVRDEGDSYELYLNGAQADVWVSSWGALKNAINDEANQGKIIGLAGEIKASDDDDRLHLKDKKVTVDLNGQRLDRDLDDDDSDGHVFELSGSSELTIKDSIGSGVITGGYAKHGGAINIHEGSVLNFQSGTISGNRATDSGGGIYVYGTLNMTGGSIAGNSAKTGGGIYCNENASKDGHYVSLKNVTISGNSTKSNGGGIDTHSGMTLENCVIKDNKTNDDCGGGIYVDSDDQAVNLIDTVIDSNSADDNGGGMNVDDGSVSMKGGAITNNQAGDNGGGVYVDEDGTFYTDKSDNAEKALISGNRAEDCGGVYVADGTAAISNTKIADNRATKYGGAGLNNKGTATVTDSEISGNKSKREGGAIYNNGKKLTLTGCTISGNEAGEDGGAVCLYTGAELNNCTITGNKTKLSGGALRVRTCTVTINGGSISQNNAEACGGGIYINNKGILNLKSASITENVGGLEGGGIYVASETGAVNLEGSVVADGNNGGGSDIYLPSGKKLTFTGALTEGAKIGVCLEDKVEPLVGSQEFTSGFAANNPNKEPAAFFVSDDGFEVAFKSKDERKEAILIRGTNEKQPFVPKNSQIVRDVNKLNGKNWMSGISGERYLNEINIPGTHDSGTASVEGNISTGMLSLYSAAATVVLSNVAGFALSGITCGTSLIAGNILGWGGMGVAPVLVSEYFKKYAKCQERYIDEQLEDGIRQLDIRLNTYYSESGYPINKNDDGENLYLLHGKDKNAGSYFCKDHDGNFLTFAKVLEWTKDFLQDHPTETVIMSVQIDSVDMDDVYDDGIARIKQHLRTLSEQLNPSTGRSYLYMDNDTFGKRYSKIPQLKDCRGQIVLLADDKEVDIFGGGTSIGQDCKNTYKPQGSYKDNYGPKIKHLTDFYNRYGGKPLPVDAGKDSHLDYYFSVGTNGTDTKIPPEETPLDIRDKVFDAMFKEGDGVLMNRKGTYLGLVNMDGVHAKEAKIVWETNFFDDLKYCTVTTKSSDTDENPKTYTVLSGTPIMIPSDIYGASTEKDHFIGWKADVHPEGHTENYFAGEFYFVTQDVTFTERFIKTDTTPVSIEWKDGENKDGLRPESLILNLTKGDKTEQVELKAENNWQTTVEGTVTAAAPQKNALIGEDAEKTYKAEVKITAMGGCQVTLTHTPAETLSGSGQITWADGDNASGTRPQSVKIQLNRKAKGQADPSHVEEKTVSAAENWTYDFGELKKYEDGQEIEYSVTQEEVDGHSSLTTGLNVKNILRQIPGKRIHGWILWGDKDGTAGTRPEKVMLRLLRKGEEVAHKEITPDENGEWPFSFLIDEKYKFSDYSIAEEAVSGYESTVEMGNAKGDVVHILNVPKGHQHNEKEIPFLLKPPTCTEEGSCMMFVFCLDCGKLLDNYMEKVPALGHDYGSWNVVKEATETEEGQEKRTCSRNPEHVETKVIPKVDPGKDPEAKVYDLSKAVVSVPDYTEDEYKEKKDSDVTVRVGDRIVDPSLYTVNWPEITVFPENNARLTVTATTNKKSGYTATGTSSAVRFKVTVNMIPASEVEAMIAAAKKEAEAAAAEARKKQAEAEAAAAEAKKKQEEAEAAAKAKTADAEAKQAEAEAAAAEAKKKQAEAEAARKVAEEKAAAAESFTAVAVPDVTAVYNGKTPKVKAAVMGSSGAVTYQYFMDKDCTRALAKPPVNAGIWYVKAYVAADQKYRAGESAAAQITIKKAANKMSVKPKTVKAKANKKTVIKVKKAFAVKKASGKVTFKKLSKNKKIFVSRKGKVTVKKGLKKGSTYKVKVKVTARGDKNHGKKTKTVILKVKVK